MAAALSVLRNIGARRPHYFSSERSFYFYFYLQINWWYHWGGRRQNKTGYFGDYQCAAKAMDPTRADFGPTLANRHGISRTTGVAYMAMGGPNLDELLSGSWLQGFRERALLISRLLRVISTQCFFSECDYPASTLAVPSQIS